MFVLSQTTSYFWPVTVHFPVTGGKFEKQTFDAEFKRLPQSRIKSINDDIQAGTATDIALASEVLVGWKGVHDDQKQEVAYSETARDNLLEVALVAGAVVVAFMESISGAAAKRKN